MGSGDTKLTAVLRPEHEGPNFDFDLESNDTDLTAFNDLLRAYGKFDVASGKVSVFSQVTVKNHYVSGYIKPLFTDLKVYDSQKDKKKPVLKKAYEVVIGGAAKLLKNRRTKKVATKIDISGPSKIQMWTLGKRLDNSSITHSSTQSSPALTRK